ncbi:hypothetical protein [Nocardia pneumoniae]|uniref:hypothetical protein n=1 Tax=Nocardia pneumoniae TaxID=228601 RepID=UPI0002F14EF2|nr:hypothetical protein [Nocardia pneumoniae]
MDPYRSERVGRYRSKVAQRIPDEQFNQLFAALTSNRDRALLSFWVSTGARAEELLSAMQGDEDPGQQLTSVSPCRVMVFRQFVLGLQGAATSVSGDRADRAPVGGRRRQSRTGR